MPDISGAVVTSFLIICPFIVLVLSMRETALTSRRTVEAMAAASARQSSDLMRILEKVVMLKGMQPHFANPQQFTPGGQSWDTYREMQEQQVRDKAQGNDVGSDEHEAKTEYLQDLADYQRGLEQEQRYAAIVNNLRAKQAAGAGAEALHPMAVSVPSELSPTPADEDTIIASHG